MAQHTEGPWFQNPAAKEEIIADGEPSVIARVPGGATGLYNKNAPANARLIAEAPAMMEALRDLVRRCDGPEGVLPDGSNIDTSCASAILARIGEA